MKHKIIIPYIFYVLLLGSSFCLGKAQHSNEPNQNVNTGHETKINETTTAEPKIGLSTATIINNLLISQTPVMTTKKVEKNESTTAVYDENATTKSIYYSQSVASTTQLHHTIHTTTAIPITVSSSTISSAQRQFDILSFMGGSLFTFCLIAIGVVLWKAYKMQTERNYRTI